MVSTNTRLLVRLTPVLTVRSGGDLQLTSITSIQLP